MRHLFRWGFCILGWIVGLLALAAWFGVGRDPSPRGDAMQRFGFLSLIAGGFTFLGMYLLGMLG